MKKIFILFLFPLCVFAQQLGNSVSYINVSDTSSAVLHFNADANYASSSLNNAFLNKFIYGGYIDITQKNEALDKTKELNNLGGEFVSSIFFSDSKNYLFKNWGYYAGITYNYQAGAEFNKDAFQLAFYGNNGFKDKNSFNTQSSFFVRDFYQFSVGLNQNNKYKVGLTFSSFNNLYGGNMDLKIQNAENGDSIAMQINADYYAVDTNKTIGFMANNAMGIGLDFETIVTLNDSSTSPKIVLGVKNVGILLHKNAYQILANNTYTYKGVEVNSLNNINTLTENDIKDSLGVVTVIENRTELFPFEVYFFQLPTYKKTIEIIYGFRYKNQSAYNAYIYAGGNYTFNSQYSISTYLGHGGYTKFQWGASFKAHWHKMQVGINTNSLLGFITDKSLGKSLGFSLTYKL